MAMRATILPPGRDPVVASTTDLMKKYELLQKAIQYGDVENAKELVSQLAKQKARVQVQEDPDTQHGFNDKIRVKVYIEDKDMSGSFITCDVYPSMKIKQLKRMMQDKHRFPIEIQKWIIGKKIVKDEDTLHKHHVKADMPLFLYLMSPKSVGLTKEKFAERYGQQAFLGLQGHAPHSGEYTYTNMGQVSRSNSRLSSQGQTPSPREAQQTPWLPNQQHRNLDLGLHHEVGGEESTYVEHMPPSMPTEMAPPPPTQPQLMSITEVGWTCPKCTFVNEPTRPGCEMCGEDRPDDYQVPQAGHYRVTEKERRRLQRESEAEALAKQTEREEERAQHAHQLDQYLTMANLGLITQDEVPLHLVDSTFKTEDEGATRQRDPPEDSDEEIEEGLRIASLDDESYARALQDEEDKRVAAEAQLVRAGQNRQGTARVGRANAHMPMQETAAGSIEQSDVVHSDDENNRDSFV